MQLEVYSDSQLVVRQIEDTYEAKSGRMILYLRKVRDLLKKFLLVSDNGKQFDNSKFRDFFAELEIKNYYSSPAHPQSNGQVEVTIRTLKAVLKTKLEDLKGKWVEYLPEVL